MSTLQSIPVELHHKDCVCRGTGWIGYPGIGPRAHPCASDRVRHVPYDRWVALGKPRNIEDHDAAEKERR